MVVKPLCIPEWTKSEEDSSDSYGKFIIEPFEGGFGTTVGNSLRRVLLSSLEGAAVTSVRFEGVQHEFSTVPGMVEDVAEVVLNLKSVLLKLPDKKERTIRFSAVGERKVYAKNLVEDEDIEILNPEQEILTLNKGAQIEIECEVGWGKGYAPAEQHKKSGQPIGTITLDAVFSPVKKVNFRVEDARVGHQTDFDRLILEIWTDGSVLPEDALAEAANILIQHFSIFVKEETKPEEGVGEEKVDDERMKLLARSVSELELSVRAANCLQAANIKTLGDLVRKAEGEMLKYRNFGKKSLEEIKQLLSDMNLTLGMRFDDDPPKE